MQPGPCLEKRGPSYRQAYSWGHSVSQTQGSHRLEKYFNLEGFLEKSLKIKYALKSTGKSHKGLGKVLELFFSIGINTVDRDLNQNKTFVPLFGAANAAPNKGTILY